jgi:hypothetical protein
MVSNDVDRLFYWQQLDGKEKEQRKKAKAKAHRIDGFRLNTVLTDHLSIA